MKEYRRGTHKFYKGSFFIVFYDKLDEYLLYMFDNVREILTFMGKPITRNNVNLINNEIYRALKTENHFTRFLTGEVLRVYIIKEDKEWFITAYAVINKYYQKGDF